MKNLLLSSFLFFFLCSCHFGHYSKLQRAGAELYLPTPVFGNNFNSFLYKTNLTVYGHDFSGLLVTKQLSPGDYRVIFTTELGMKMFDFEFKDTSFTLHYCMPAFDRPKLLNLIRNDIEVLLMNHQIVSDGYFKQNDLTIVREPLGKRTNYYFCDPKHNVIRIEQAKKSRKKVIFTISDRSDGFPEKIFIQHFDARLKIELNLLKK
jgi:hypothetical protein